MTGSLVEKKLTTWHVGFKCLKWSIGDLRVHAIDFPLDLLLYIKAVVIGFFVCFARLCIFVFKILAVLIIEMGLSGQAW